MFFESPFHGYPTCLTFDHVVWWSTALWTARTTRRRRPGRYLTLECITSVEIFFYKDVICSGKDGYSGIFYTFNMPNIPNHIKYMRFGCRRHRGRQGQQDGEDQGGGITSVEFFSNRTWYAVVVILVDMKVFYTFNMYDNIKYTWFGVRRHSGWRGRQGGENQVGCLHQDELGNPSKTT